MVEIIEVPPEESPKIITARHVIHGLGEHLTAFLAANNMHGWTADEEYVLRDDRIADQLLMVSQSTGLYLVRLKRMSRLLMRLGTENSSALKLSTIQDMLARALGYSGYQIANQCRTTDDFIENIWPMGAAMSLHTLNEESDNIAINPVLLESLRARVALNKKRDQVFHTAMGDPVAAKILKRERRAKQRPQFREGVKQRPS